jgi:hypothetical protein
LIAPEAAALFLRGIVLGVLVAAGVGKVRRYRQWTLTVRAYRIVPSSVESLAAAAIIALEITVGSLLVVNPFAPWPTLVACALLGSFTILLAVQIARGMASMRCGCLGVLDLRPKDAILRNIGLLVLLVVSELLGSATSWTWPADARGFVELLVGGIAITAAPMTLIALIRAGRSLLSVDGNPEGAQ